MEPQEQTLHNLLERIANERELKNYKIAIKRTSTDGANISSIVFFATISSDNRDDIKIFAKVATMGEKMRDMAPYRIYDSEKFFYTDLVESFKKLERKYKVPHRYKFVTPEFYGLSFEYLKEAFALEDLTKKGYQMFDRFKTYDWNYAKEAMTQLARLHALSMAYSIEQPDEFEVKTKDIASVANGDFIKFCTMEVIGIILTSVKEEYRSRVEKFFKQTATTDELKAMIQPKKCVVLAHGDYRPSNLMHKLNEDGSYSIVPVDYQTMYRCNPIVDILYFIFTGSDQKFRAQYYQRTLDQYYFELSAALRRFHLNPDVIYSHNHFEEELREVLPYGLLVGLLILNLITVETDEMLDNDTIKSFECEPSEVYKWRVNEIVEDYIAMGVL